MWAAGNGGSYFDSCAADGYVNSIYTIAVGSADQNGQQAYYDENCSAKMAVTFSYNSDSQPSTGNRHNQLVNALIYPIHTNTDDICSTLHHQMDNAQIHSLVPVLLLHC